MISCNKTDDDFSNNVPQADPSEVLFTWEGGEKDIAVRPTQGTRMTQDWFFVEADLPEEAVFTKERVIVDTTKTPGVKVISNSWVTLTVTDLGRQIKVKALRNRTPRSARFVSPASATTIVSPLSFAKRVFPTKNTRGRCRKLPDALSVTGSFFLHFRTPY